MAVRLRELGADVGTLIMLDTQTSDSVPEASRTPTLGMLFAELRQGVDEPAVGDGELTPERAAQLLHESGGPYASLTADDLRRLYDDYVHTVGLGRITGPRCSTATSSTSPPTADRHGKRRRGIAS